MRSKAKIGVSTQQQQQDSGVLQQQYLRNRK